MGILITTVDIGGIVIQGGHGSPNHIATRGTSYVDFDAGVEYINKDGINTWAVQLDSSFSGGTGSTGFDVFVTGGTFDNNTGIATFRNNTGGTFTVTGFSTTSSTFTGGTITGPTNFTAGLTSSTVTAGSVTATTISATTYLGLPIDVYVTGGTFASSASSITFTNRTGGTFNVSGITTSSGSVSTATTITINGVTKNLSTSREWLTLQGNTGILNFSSGLTLNNATAGTINIASMYGYIVDNETNPSIPTHIFIGYSGSPTSGVTVTTRNSGQASYVLLNSSAVPIFQNTFPTSAQRKQNIWLGKIGHPLSGTITTVINEPDFLTSPQSQVNDLFQAINYINDGVYPYYSGANLSFNITAGDIHGNGINLHNSRLNPNEILMGPITSGASFFYRTQTGGTQSATTFIDPTNYDVGGIITPVPSTASTIQWIFAVPGAGFVVQYGQFLYPSLLNAVLNIGREQFTVFPNLVENAILIGVVAVTQTATNLSIPTQGLFFRADKFGQIIGAQAGISTTNLQAAYDNSVQPQLVITPTGGALQIKGINDFGPTLQGLNSGGTPTFAVDGFGNVSATTLHGSTGGTIGLILGNQNIPSVDGTSPIAEFNDQTGEFSDLVFRVAGDGIPVLNLITSEGTLEVPTTSLPSNQYGQLIAWGFTSAYTQTASIYFNKNGTPTNTSLPSSISFNTTPIGGVIEIERFSINNQGQLTINTTPSAGTNSDSILVRTSGGLVRQVPFTSSVFTGGTVTGATRFTGGITANTISGISAIFSSLTATTISATTYLGLPIDIRVTGGTVSGSNTTFTNNTGGTFNVTGTSFWAFSGTGPTITNTNTGNVIIKGLDTGATDALQVITSANTLVFQVGNNRGVGINTLPNAGSNLDVRQTSSAGGTYSGRFLDSTGNMIAGFRQGVGIETAIINSIGSSGTIINGNQGLVLNYVNPVNGSINMTSSGPISSTLTNVTKNWVNVTLNLSPFSGSSALTFNTFSIFPTVNFSGGTTTLVRGLFINPTLSFLSGTNEYRAIEVTTGKTILDTLSATSITATTISATTYLNLPPSTSTFTGGTITGATFFSNGLSANTISATTYLGLPTDVYVTAGTFSTLSSTITFTNTTGGTFNVSGLSVSASFSGGTVTGATLFTGGLSATSLSATSIITNSLTATTISATTYLGLPPDVFVTAGTFSSSSSSIIFTNTTGGTFNVTGISSSSIFTGGTVTGATFFSNGLSANTISATTYLGLPIDVYLTGGTFTANTLVASGGTTTFRNTTGGTFVVSGQAIPNLYYAEFSAAPTTAPFVASGGSIALGENARALSTSMFVFGNNAGNGATGASSSIFMGVSAGQGANGASGSVFMGINAGLNSNANSSIFIGTGSGGAATGLTQGIFMGQTAGNGANLSSSSVFIGSNAGQAANNSSSAVYIGPAAGQGASGSGQSVFIGQNAGLNANNSVNDNFIGVNAGNRASGTSNSSFIGYQAGSGSTSVGNSIIIGTNIALPNGTAAGLNIGGVLFGRGFYTDITGPPSLTAQTNGRIGINVAVPTQALEVSGNSKISSNSTGITLLVTSSTQNVLTVIGSGNSNTSPIFSVQGSQGELFSVSDSLIGSLFSVNDISGLPVLEVFSDDTILMGSYLSPSLNTTVKVLTSAGTNNIYNIPTSAYTGAFVDYTVANGLNLRAGNIMAVWTTATTQYTESSTNDIGNTSGITFSVVISGSNAVLRASGTTSGWVVKSIIRSI